MKKKMVLMCTFSCCCAMAHTNTFSDLVSEMPITFEPLEFQFFRNVNLKSSSKEDVDRTTESKETTSDTQKTDKKQKIESSASAGVSHESTIRTASVTAAAGLTGGGAAGSTFMP